ncbi:RHS repeat-associated core domain-containing protein [Brevundimonas sp. M20]|uniref:RHS repeat-associated core domain-containing protein n=1 Tax=Brevundimonas sp. M20 TaxID=2591463 RepID=UPI0011468995|nr:RHS repeat-associated core domain-containing protein [Brevundimonas sp. M20]QDH74224.1 RHS repeat-associated core domain-containing protein [Brevundimonas sp. M20]
MATAGVAEAQTLPPERYTLDARGVDLIRKEWTPTGANLSVGGTTGLSYGWVLLGNQWWDSAISGMNNSGTQATVTADGVTEIFDTTVTGWAPREKLGSTLTRVGTTNVYLYQRGGTVWRFETLGFVAIPPGPFEYFASSREEPNGLKTDFTYVVDSYFDPEEGIETRVGRLQSYQNNAGYQIHYEYKTDTLTPESAGEWLSVQKVMGLNLAVDFCDKAAFTCTGLTRTWPSVTFSAENPGPTIQDLIFTDQSGIETRYRTRGTEDGGIRELLVGSNPVPVVSVLHQWSGEVRSITDASGTWDYTFFDRTAVRLETTIEGPSGQKLFVVSDPSIGLVTSATESTSASPATSRTWSWTYDDGYRVETATGPEGETAEYEYDDRGNITQATLSPKTGGTEADIVTSAVYPASCANPVTCNLPTSTTDAAGRVTDYAWDSTHGGITSVTLPAPSTGAARPQTRYAYAAQTAQFKNSSGVIVAAPTAITLPVEVSACVTGASCDATANEVLTTLNYGVTTGVANNLNVASVSRGSGVDPAMSVTAYGWTPDGDVATVDGPLSGAADTTQYRYDTSRRVVGMVGPDPDGAGPALHRAQRVTYNDRGQPTLTEAGTTAGYSDPNWAAFAPLLQSSTTYDDFGRPVEARQLSGAGIASGVQQVTYDDSGRVSCVATRMNPATFAALPASACTAATEGEFGPDRIVQTTYDIANRPVSSTSAYGASNPVTESVTYGVNGQASTLTDGEGNVSAMEYDGYNRPLRLRYPNATGGGTSTTDYEQITYDAYGRISGVRNRSGDTTYFGYDNLNRTIAINAPGSTPDISSAYDNLGRMTVTGNGTITVVTGWDALSRPVSEASSVIGAMEYQYDAAGNLTRIEWPDDFGANYTYDLYGGVTAISQQPAGGSATQVAAYGWNNLGQPVSTSRAGGAGASTTRSYDAWGRLSGLSHDATGTTNDVALGFSYNPAGQIIGRTVSNEAYVYSASPTGSTTYAVDGLNQLDSINSVAVTHDSRGNVTGALGNAYGYDDLNRLTSANAGAGATSFTFDPMNRLATSTVGGASIRRQYVGDQLVAEYNPATGGMLKRYIPGLGLDDVAVAYDGSGTSTRNWQLADERGSVIALSGSTGAVSNINTYDEYGVPGSSNTGRFQYTGQQWLPETGAYHYRARAYLPQVGRFLQTDPVGYSAGTNLYGYVGADPINWVDPSGLQEVTTLPGTEVTARCPILTRWNELLHTCTSVITSPPQSWEFKIGEVSTFYVGSGGGTSGSGPEHEECRGSKRDHGIGRYEQYPDGYYGVGAGLSVVGIGGFAANVIDWYRVENNVRTESFTTWTFQGLTGVELSAGVQFFYQTTEPVGNGIVLGGSAFFVGGEYQWAQGGSGSPSGSAGATIGFRYGGHWGGSVTKQMGCRTTLSGG